MHENILLMYQKISILINGFWDNGDQGNYAYVTWQPFLGIILSQVSIFRNNSPYCISACI